MATGVAFPLLVAGVFGSYWLTMTESKLHAGWASAAPIAAHPEWARDAAIYEVNVRQFTPEGTFSALLPHLAEIADDVAIVKSMWTTQFNHAPGQIFMNTGHQIPGRPSLGSWLAYGIGSESTDLPGFVVLLSGTSQPDGGKYQQGEILPPHTQLSQSALQSGDHQALDLARALVDARHARVAVELLDHELGRVAHAAMDLHRAVDDAPQGLAAEQLDDRRLAAERLAEGERIVMDGTLDEDVWTRAAVATDPRRATSTK